MPKPKIQLSEKNNKVMLYGRALESLIVAINQLGPVGEAILLENNATNIQPDDLYSTRKRADLYDSLLNRYGSSALRSVGFEMSILWEKNFPTFFSNKIKTNKKKNLFPKKSERIIQPIKGSRVKISLEECCAILMDSWNLAIEQFCKTDDPTYQTYSRKIRPLNFEFFIKSPGVQSRHVDFFLTNLYLQVMRLVGSHYHVRIRSDEKRCKDEYHGCTFVYQLNFKRRTVRVKIEEDLLYEGEKIRKEFLKSVLVFSENQKKIADKKSLEATAQKKKIESISQQIGKYIPPQIHQSLLKGKYDTTIATRRKKITIFFSDIANFTSTSEGLQPEDLTKYLNEYFSEMTTIALDCGATIDKYIGDAMMVFFGDPESNGEKEDARACVEMALKMQERMEELQAKWRNEGFADPFQVRMGINTGYCNVGNFGSDQRLTYTIIGGEVNVAQRLEASADANGIFMSYETYAHAQDFIEVEQRETIKMKGISREIKAFSVVDRKSKVGKEKKEIKKKPTKREQSQIEKLEKDVARIDNNLHELNKNMEKLLNKL